MKRFINIYSVIIVQMIIVAILSIPSECSGIIISNSYGFFKPFGEFISMPGALQPTVCVHAPNPLFYIMFEALIVLFIIAGVLYVKRNVSERTKMVIAILSAIIVWVILPTIVAVRFMAWYGQSKLLNTVVPTQGNVSIQLEKEKFKKDEIINFKIINDTNKVIYYFPDTCASDLVDLYQITETGEKIVGRLTVCLLAPSVTNAPANTTINGSLQLHDIELTPGMYKLKFNYSTTPGDTFNLENPISVSSRTFAVTE